MPRRQTATEKWEDRWFMALSPNVKNILEFMEAKCDCAGVWEPNFEDAEYRIGFQAKQIAIDWNEVFEELNRIPPKRFVSPDDQLIPTDEEKANKRIPHVMVLKNGKWWLPRFVKFQYCKQGEAFHLYNAPLHIPIFRSLKANGCWEKFLEFYPGVVGDDMAKAPPDALKGAAKSPTLEEVMTWDEGKGLPDTEVKLFYVTYKSNGWKVNGQKADDYKALLAKWKLRYDRDKGDQAWRTESPAQLKIRIDGIDSKIAELSQQTHKPVGKLHEEIRPEAMDEIRRLKGVKALYEEAIREKGRNVSSDKQKPKT